MTQPLLGRFVQHDARSRNFPARTAATLKAVLWQHKAPVLDQGQLGSCTGNALVDALNCEAFTAARPGGTYLTEQDAVRVYSLATTLDDAPGTYPPDDTGSSGIAACKAGKQLGYLTGYTHAFGATHALASLMLSPVMIGSNWTEGMFTPDSSGFVKPTGSVEGGHEYLAIGYDPGNGGVVTCLNSWGSSWGINGRFQMRYGDFAELLAADGDATVPVGVTVAPTPTPAPVPATPVFPQTSLTALIQAQQDLDYAVTEITTWIEGQGH